MVHNECQLYSKCHWIRREESQETWKILWKMRNLIMRPIGRPDRGRDIKDKYKTTCISRMGADRAEC